MIIKAVLLSCVLGLLVFHPVNVLSNGNSESERLLFESKCSRCHGLDKITQTVKTPDQWSLTVNRMREKDMNWISEEEAQTITTYLSSNFSGENPYQNNQSNLSRILSFLPELFG